MCESKKERTVRNKTVGNPVTKVNVLVDAKKDRESPIGKTEDRNSEKEEELVR